MGIQKNKVKKISYFKNILLICICLLGFLILITADQLLPVLNQEIAAAEIPKLSDSRSSISGAVGSGAVRTVNESVKTLLMNTNLFYSVEAAANLILDQTIVHELEQQYSTADGKDQGYLERSTQYNQETESSATTATDQNYLPNETLTFTQVPAGLIKADQSSIAVCATIQKIYSEDTMKNQGLLNDVSFTQFVQENNQPVLVPSDPGLITAISSATGIPESNVTLSVYETPVFEPAESTFLPFVTLFPVFRPALYILFAGIFFLQLILMIRKSMIIARVNFTERKQHMKEKPDLGSNQKQPKKLNQITNIPTPEEDPKLKKVRQFIDEHPDKASQSLKNWLQD